MSDRLRIYAALSALLLPLALGACGGEELGPPACDASLRDGSAAGSWIRVEPGSFRMGVNEEFQRRHVVDRGYAQAVWPQMHATITRPYFAMATEVTNAMWDELIPNNPAASRDCPTCPVTFVRRADALMFANALSERDGLQPCYELATCIGEPGTQRADCPLDITFDFECEGYRLPTAGEFEYLARAGTTTDHHCGTLRKRTRDQCVYDHEWTGNNWRLRERFPSDELEVQPVATLCPNPWGFYDVGGNVAEHVWDLREPDSTDPWMSGTRVVYLPDLRESDLLAKPWAASVIDPLRPVFPNPRLLSQQVGDTYNGGVLGLAAAGSTAAFPVNTSAEVLWPVGFRLVRTVPAAQR